MTDQFRKLSRESGRYAPEAFQFVYESLEPAIQLARRGAAEGTEHHVTGQELLAGMRAHATRIFGPLAAQVWRSWGVHEALDWGRIVFLLVDAGLLNRQESDTLEDFRAGFDFDEVFVDGYRLETPPELGGGAGPGPGAAPE